MNKDQSTESTEAKAEATEAKADAMGVDSSDMATDTDANAANVQSANGTDETSVNDRLLRESKEWKAKALEAKKELERIKEGEKKKQGKYQELADEYKAKLDSLEKKVIKQKVQTALLQAAPKFGFAGKSHETLLKLGDASLLQYDETTEEVQGIDLYLESLKKAEPTLFRMTDAKINDRAPSNDSIVGRKIPQTFEEKQADLRRKLAESLQKGA